MSEFLGPIIDFFWDIYDADKRPEARKMTIGCLVIVLIVIAILGVVFSGPLKAK